MNVMHYLGNMNVIKSVLIVLTSKEGTIAPVTMVGVEIIRMASSVQVTKRSSLVVVKDGCIFYFTIYVFLN